MRSRSLTKLSFLEIENCRLFAARNRNEMGNILRFCDGAGVRAVTMRRLKPLWRRGRNERPRLPDAYIMALMEWHLRYPGMSQKPAQGIADKINSGMLDSKQGTPIAPIE